MKEFRGIISFFSISTSKPPYTLKGFEIEDQKNGDIILKGEMTYDEFGKCLTTIGEFNGTLYDSSHIGMVREIKREQIEFRILSKIKDEDSRYKRAVEILKPYNVDGWIGNPKDLLDIHNFDSRSGTYTVTFTRYKHEEEMNEMPSNDDYNNEL